MFWIFLAWAVLHIGSIQGVAAAAPSKFNCFINYLQVSIYITFHTLDMTFSGYTDHGTNKGMVFVESIDCEWRF